MKPVRLFCYMFCQVFFSRACTRSNGIPVILNVLTNRNIVLIYSVTICEQKTRLCTVRELPTQTTPPLFSTLMFAGFPNQSPLLTMVLPRCPPCRGVQMQSVVLSSKIMFKIIYSRLSLKRTPRVGPGLSLRPQKDGHLLMIPRRS